MYPLVPQAEARAALAQSVERFTRNEKVASSILAGGSIQPPVRNTVPDGGWIIQSNRDEGRGTAERSTVGRMRGDLNRGGATRGWCSRSFPRSPFSGPW